MTPARPRILFVDDEDAVLDGLRDLLRKESRQWDMVFACGGERALAEVRASPFDIVVSDMRMPGMDGAALLTRVKLECPGTARIVLSGHADRDAIMRAMPVAQQFLCKPCDPVELRAALARTHGLQCLLGNDVIREAVGSVDKLPSVPRTYVELTRLAADPSKGMMDLAAVVERDPAMSAKALQLVNSAYFGVAHRVIAIRQAVAYLGVELLKGLALTSGVFAAMEKRPVAGLSLDRLWKDSLLTARLAKRYLATSQTADEAFTAGLLHDVGKIVIALSRPQEYANVARLAGAGGGHIHDVEREALGFTHAEAGAYLLGLWGLPFSIVEAVAYHHQPGLVPEGTCDVLAAVHVADALTGVTRSRPPLDAEFLERSGVAAILPAWQTIAEEEMGRLEGMAA
ncbi:MAG: response regulator [Deltaproteobacteria bacterium]